MLVVALVGMPGAGKTEASGFFEKAGFEKVYFGQVVLDELKKRGLPIKEEFEKEIREWMRKRHGMAAPAVLNLPKITALVGQKRNVVIEDLYSWEELLFLREHFPGIIVVAIFSSPATRHKRLSKRAFRSLSPEEAGKRDVSEIENLQKGGPIAMADYAVSNEGTMKELEKEIKKIIKKIKEKK